MGFLRGHTKEAIVITLIFLNVFVWVLVYQKKPTDVLSVYFLDVGQGDAILIDSPQHNRILIDGGRNRKVLSELGKILPFSDKHIDIVIATHPDADHIGGLPEVVDRYDVELFLKSGVRADTSLDNELDERIKEKNIPTLLARRGMVVNFGDGVELQILFPLPDQDVSNWETNRASIVARLVSGEKSFLLTGDSPISIENVLLNLDSTFLDADVLKAGHHGSRTSTSLEYAKAVSPVYTVISAGKDNTYGHPHQEVLDILSKVGTQIISTETIGSLEGMGTITFQTDGETLELK